MNASISCISCLIGKQEKLIRQFSDEDKKKAFFQDFLTLIQQEGMNRTAPWLQEKADRLLDRYFGTIVDYPALKSRYNQYLLSKEAIFGLPPSSSSVINVICFMSAFGFTADMPDLTSSFTLALSATTSRVPLSSLE